MYSLAAFGNMLTSQVRMDAYIEALRRTVTPTSVVIDLGSGTGIWSLLACRVGARRVYAIEASPAIQILVAAARDNGVSDRIVVLQRRSTEVSLPERADVMVSDLRGILPPWESHFADIVDARRRLLAPHGKMIPDTDTLKLAVVSAPEAVEAARRPWLSAPLDLDLRSALPYVDSTLVKYRAQPDQLLSAPATWARLHYPTLVARGVRGTGSCRIERDGTAHGLLAWFDTELVDGVGFSNAPGAPDGIYGQLLFPWPEALTVHEGDTVAFDVRADTIASQVLWTWSTEVRTAEVPATAVRSFRQSTFQSLPIERESLRRRAPEFVPTLSTMGVVALQVLEGLRGQRSIGELAREMLASNPEYFRTLDDAHGFVAELSQRYAA